jgi:hypothetical protein
MLKKIIVVSLLIGVTSILILGGVNRSFAKTGEGNAFINSGQGQRQGTSNTLNGVHEDFDNLEGNGFQRFGRGSIDVNETQNEYNYGTQGNNYRGGRGNNGSKGQRGGFEPLDDLEIQALKMALDDEYHALAVYESVIATFGSVEPFVEIALSEQRHIDALVNQFDKQGILVPDNNWIGNIPAFDSIQSACQAGVGAEIANVDLYNRLFSMTDDSRLIQVFTNLSRASQESHLPQFESCQ